MKLSYRDVIYLCLFLSEVVNSYSFCFHCKGKYKDDVINLRDRLIIEREERWNKGLKKYNAMKEKKKK